MYQNSFLSIHRAYVLMCGMALDRWRQSDRHWYRKSVNQGCFWWICLPYGKHPPPKRPSWLFATLLNDGYIIRIDGNFRSPVGCESRRKLCKNSLFSHASGVVPKLPRLELCATTADASSIGAECFERIDAILQWPCGYPAFVSLYVPGIDVTRKTFTWKIHVHEVLFVSIITSNSIYRCKVRFSNAHKPWL